MSRRRVSVKDLGAVDCQGWLHRKKESRSFLGSRWKRYWFVLKGSSLYWYSDKTAEKADGFINLSGFTIEQAKLSRKKYVITASHPLVVTLFIGAESYIEMNKWISKMTEAAELYEATNSEERYSEDSDRDEDECPPFCSLDPQLDLVDSQNGNCLQPPWETLSCTSLPTVSTPITESRNRTTSAGSTLSRNQRRRPVSEGGSCLSWLDLPRQDEASRAETPPLIHVNEEKEKRTVQEKPPDEMETLYNHLKAASLSPTGQTCKRDFRASFIRRCKNDKVNEKVHLLRILKSTLKQTLGLKSQSAIRRQLMEVSEQCVDSSNAHLRLAPRAKESELLALEQILSFPNLTAPTYREWRFSNTVLLQDITQHNRGAEGATKLRRESI